MSAGLETERDYDTSQGEPFEKEGNGLVNLDSYLSYLVDPPERVPTRLEIGSTSRYRFVHQHAYFKERDYLQLELPSEARNRRLAALRKSPHSQVIMRSYEEIRMHLEKEPSVEPPPDPVIDDTLRDYFDIDLVGAATLGIQETIRPRPPDDWATRFVPPPELRALSKHDRIDIFVAARNRALDSLSSPRALPQRLVTSALTRMAIHLDNPTLERIAGERLAGDKVYYPLAVPKRGHLRIVGGHVLNEALGNHSLEEARLTVQALQPGVNKLKLAA